MVSASRVPESYGIYNYGGVQTIESKPEERDSVFISAVNTSANGVAYSIFVNPRMDDTPPVSATTTTELKGNFNIKKGDIVVSNSRETNFTDNSTLHLLPDTQQRKRLILEEGVNLLVKQGALDATIGKLTTQLVLGDDRDSITSSYDIELGRNSQVNDLGIFRGLGNIIPTFDKASFDNAKANDSAVPDEDGKLIWNFVGTGYGIVSGGVLMRNVEKTLGGNNSHLDVVIPISADEVPDEHFAYQVMRSAVNNLFVDQGIDNIRERIDLEKWEDENGVYEKYKYVSGKVYINEGKINGGYEEEYYYDDPEIVGNQNNIRDLLETTTLRIVPTEDGQLTDEKGFFTSYTDSHRKVTLPLETTAQTTYSAVYLEYTPPELEKPGTTPGTGQEPSGPGTESTTLPEPEEPKVEAPAAGTPLTLKQENGKLGYVNADGKFKEFSVNEAGQFVDENGFPVELSVTTDNAKAIYAWEGEIGEKIFEETVEVKEPPKEDPKDPGSSSTVDTIDSLTITDYYLWRLENETLYQRMGEIRDRADLEGGWVRLLSGKNSLDKSKYYFKHKYYGIQLGFDHVANKEEGGSWILGVGATYTHGKTDLRNSGSGKNWLGTLSLYGVRKFGSEAYLDLILKASRIHHDYTAISNQMRYLSKGKYHTYALQASAEVGKKFMLNDEWYFDPQLQLSYGHIKGAKYRTDSDINVRTDALNSLIGRAGASVGREFKEGSAFVKIDLLREFKAKYKAHYSLDNGARNQSQINLKDTWGEVTIGGTYNFRKDTYGFAQVKRSFASDVKQEYRADIGLRYVF